MNELDLYSYTYSSFINIDKSQCRKRKVSDYVLHDAFYMKLKRTKHYILMKDTYMCSKTIKKFMRIINTKFRVMVASRRGGRAGGETGTSNLWVKLLKLSSGDTDVCYSLYFYIYLKYFIIKLKFFSPLSSRKNKSSLGLPR